LARDLIVGTGASFRCAAGVLALIAKRFALASATPCFSTIRSWIIRLGCYSLRCPLPQHTSWVWMVDHTIQIGPQKLLAVVGCVLTDVPFGKRSLTLGDLRLIALVPMTHSTHEHVAAELEKATARTGVPRLIVSDHGTDVKKGVEDFQKRHPITAHVHDIAHYGANVLENRWERDPRWQEFLRQLQQVNQKMRQTADAYLVAPTLRPKGRFMSVGPLLRFAKRVLQLLEREKPHEKVVARYGWLGDYRQPLEGWLEEHRLTQTTIEWVRRHGINSETLEKLERTWGKLSERPSTGMVAGYMRVYVRKYGRQAQPSETLVGSTEALESSFGKLKRLEGDKVSGGFTGLVLALGALTGNASEATVREALDAVPQKEADGWIKRNLGATLRWLRKSVFGKEQTVTELG
jgi:hypothetical protein